ncbi:DUF1616 domain-containing protein [Candidatus Parcubacteria bacterium]|nr:DUF1616 domain-containing protein [Candidatus Parcubacteria bacterium]
METALQMIQMITGAVYVLFLPGLVLSFLFFRRGTIDLIERLALSFALSIAVVPLVAFYLSLIGIKISPVAVLLEVAGVMALAGLGILLRRRLRPAAPPEPAPPPTPAPPPPPRPKKRLHL